MPQTYLEGALLGPSRLILINSGPYDYAEVILNRSGHLVGENNVGKTSLIAVLQFLYMADQRDMRFSEDLDASRAFYFKTEQSYIVFELNTPEGTKCLLVQGLGPAQMHSFDRWVYNGPYRREHYLDGKRVRKPSEILPELAASCDPRKLKPSELRQALTGIGRKSTVPLLGIVPVRQSENYGRFLSVFRNLIHLDQVRQHELKNLLIEISRGEIRSTEINLAEQYGVIFDGLRRDTNAQSAFEHMRVNIHEALEADQQRHSARRQLAPLWLRYKELLEQETDSLNERIRQAKTQAQELEQQWQQLARHNSQLSSQHGELKERLGGVKGQLAALEVKERELAELDENFERNALNTIQGHLEQARKRLYAAAAADSVERIQRRLADNTAERDQLQRRLQNVEQLLASWLRQHYSDEQLAHLFRLINPALLGQAMGESDGILVNDEAALRARIDAVLEQIRDEHYSDPIVTMALASLPVAGLEDFSDPAAMRRRLDDLEQAIGEDSNALQAAEQRQTLQAEVDRLQVSWEATQKTLVSFDQLREMRVHAAEWQAESKTLEVESARVRAEQEGLEAKRSELQQLIDTNKTLNTQLAAQEKDLREKHTLLFARMNQRPERFDWEPGPMEWSAESAKEAREAVERVLDQEEAQSRKVNDALERISRQPQHTRFMGDGPETEQLAQLRERVEAADEEQRALQRRWEGLLKGLSQEAAQLLAGLDVLDRQCQRLNSQISKLSISNLRGFSVRVERARELLAQLIALRDYGAEQAEMALGVERELDIADALEQVERALRLRPIIRLSDAFELAFDVSLPNGQSRSYAQLSQIQSDGTTVTIKVVINLLLLRGLLNPKQQVSVPFYLDEVAKLSINNVHSIVHLAKSQNCVPILASPSELEAADILYLLRPTANNRLVLTEDHRVELQHSPVLQAEMTDA